ncbi:MAG: CDP-alcohol phosphatidyltransferase family protein [Oscillospiraceae bacterium]|nr:CDP-alcohol phosphatidyltransferase family protein [Oscillospiraceae bacterium]
MFIHDWKKEVFTIPNMLSLFRLILIPVYVSIYMNATGMQEYFMAGSILAVSCLTDMVDGQIARHFNMISTVGKILDPVADKLTQFTLTLCLSVKYPVLRFVLMLFVVKEMFQAVMGLIHLRRGKMLPGALPAGKVCTTVLFLSLIVLVLLPQLQARIVDIIAIIDTVFLSLSFIAYIFAYFGKHTVIQDLGE